MDDFPKLNPDFFKSKLSCLERQSSRKSINDIINSPLIVKMDKTEEKKGL